MPRGGKAHSFAMVIVSSGWGGAQHGSGAHPTLAVLRTAVTKRRAPIVIGAFVVLLFLAVGLTLARFWPRELSAESIARIEETCRAAQPGAIDELLKHVPPTATDGEAFVRGLEQLPFLVAVLSERSTAYEEAQTTPPSALATAARADGLQRLDLSLDVATCYERELVRFPSVREQVAAAIADLRQEREALATADFSPFYATGEPATAIITLAPQEVKRVRLRTLCIDRFAPPPEAGTPYLLGGTVDELQKQSLCDLLREAQRGGDLAPTQNAVWRLEQERMDPTTTVVSPAAGATGIFAAQRERALLVTAEATGTLTALDVTLTNTTTSPLTLDTSCAYFVPLSLPDLNQPLPSPPPDWSDPKTAEKFSADIERQTLQNLDEQEKMFQKLGLPFPAELQAEQERLRQKYGSSRLPAPAVKGVYRSVFLPGSDNVDPATLDRFQTVQTGLGLQPLGAAGVVRGVPPRGRLEIARLRDLLRRNLTDPLRARENLDRALDAFARNPSGANAQELYHDLQSCIVNNCASAAEVARIWEQVQARADQLVDLAVERLIASVTAQTLQDAIDAMRFCQVVGCTVAADAERLDAHLRNIIRDRARRHIPATAEE